MHPLKKAESLVREVRSFVLPSHISMYRRILSERMVRDSLPDAPLAVLDLKSLKADADAGRFVYLTYRRLAAAGYSVLFRNRFRTLANFEARRYKLLLLEHPFGVVRGVPALNGKRPPGGEHRGGLWISDSRGEPPAGLPGDWQRVRIVYDHRLPSAPGEVAHTFAMHPDVYESEKLIPREHAMSGERRWCRIFFAGNASPRAYARDRMGAGHPVMTRVESLEAATRAAGDAMRVLHARNVETRDPANREPGFAMIDTSVASIAADQWVRVLSGVSFFFAPPGASFPLSHNAVEAMHAGAIPILQYPQYFDPPLTNGENCLAYRNAAELQHRIRQALAMDEESIARLRHGAVEYYYKHLSLEPLILRLQRSAQVHREAVWLFHSFTAPVRA